MKKIVGLMALAAMLFVTGTMLTGCAGKNSSAGNEKASVSEKPADSAKSSETKKASGEKYTLVGEWKYPDEYMPYVYAFNADGTGSYGLDADSAMKFTYKDDGKSVEILYDGFTDGNKYDYTISGNKLSIKDDFGSDVVYERK